MLVAEYIVNFLIEQKVSDVFGYPGGMVTHIMEALSKHKSEISSRLSYNEQGAAMAACGYAQSTGKLGVAYATSGPGVTNLVTGIANAYFDSIPCIFMTGQVNTYEAKGALKVRQKGFQEMDVLSIVNSITKYAVQLTDASAVRYELEKAVYVAMSGRKGPVVLDIPMNIQRTEVDVNNLAGFEVPWQEVDVANVNSANRIIECLEKAKRPLIIAGAGIRSAGAHADFKTFVNKFNIPVVTSMIGIDCMTSDSKYNMGFIGAYGHRWANILTAKADLIISIGSRLDCRQVGVKREEFAAQAKILRVDIDSSELEHKSNPSEEGINCDIQILMDTILNDEKLFKHDFTSWLQDCATIKSELLSMDNEPANTIVTNLSGLIPESTIITTDVGQNQVWIAQSLKIKAGQKVLFSGGHGAMGYSLPAAIGACYATKKSVICFTGDGGMQMNIQELQMIARDRLPVKVIILNNQSLGMIRHFQEMYFDANYTLTVPEEGYGAPDFCKIAEAYGIKSYCFDGDYGKMAELINDDEPVVVDIDCGKFTYIFPKLAINKPVYDQEPLIDRALMERLMK